VQQSNAAATSFSASESAIFLVSMLIGARPPQRAWRCPVSASSASILTKYRGLGERSRVPFSWRCLVSASSRASCAEGRVCDVVGRKRVKDGVTFGVREAVGRKWARKGFEDGDCRLARRLFPLWRGRDARKPGQASARAASPRRQARKGLRGQRRGAKRRVAPTPTPWQTSELASILTRYRGFGGAE
jgi:hypothetical protein